MPKKGAETKPRCPVCAENVPLICKGKGCTNPIGIMRIAAGIRSKSPALYCGAKCARIAGRIAQAHSIVAQEANHNARTA